MAFGSVRRPPRAVLLRVAAVLVVVVTAAIVASDLASLHRRANEFGAPRAAVVARHDLTLGTTIRRDDLTTRTIYSSQLPPDVFGRIPDAVGRVITVPVLRDAYVARGNVASRRRSGLDGALPDGMRALRIVVTEAVEPRVGAAVDVLASFESDSLDPLSELEVSSAVVIADGVTVLGTDVATNATGAAARGVTLLVTPGQARDLLFAMTHGVVTIALVPPEDARGS
jgi:Flp pilus assembly protein CpaB